MRRGRRAIGTLAVALAAVLAACGQEAGEDRGAAQDALSPEAPAYSAVTLDGDSVALADLRGSPVLLNVWATWCAPCRHEVPELEALHQRYGSRGLRVIGVSVDSRSARDDIRSFMEEFGMTYDVWLDPDQTAVSRFEAVGVPLTVLIGPEGRIRWRHLGAVPPDDPGLRQAVESLL